MPPSTPKGSFGKIACQTNTNKLKPFLIKLQPKTRNNLQTTDSCNRRDPTSLHTYDPFPQRLQNQNFSFPPKISKAKTNPRYKVPTVQKLNRKKKNQTLQYNKNTNTKPPKINHNDNHSGTFALLKIKHWTKQHKNYLLGCDNLSLTQYFSPSGLIY